MEKEILAIVSTLKSCGRWSCRWAHVWSLGTDPRAGPLLAQTHGRPTSMLWAAVRSRRLNPKSLLSLFVVGEAATALCDTKVMVLCPTLHRTVLHPSLL